MNSSQNYRIEDPEFADDLAFFARAAEPDHIDPDRLGELLAATLSPAETEHALQHLASCDFCIDLLDQLEPFIVPTAKASPEVNRLLELARNATGALSGLGAAIGVSRLFASDHGFHTPVLAGQDDHVHHEDAPVHDSDLAHSYDPAHEAEHTHAGEPHDADAWQDPFHHHDIDHDSPHDHDGAHDAEHNAHPEEHEAHDTDDGYGHDDWHEHS